jgi:hypothetical protein
MGGATCFLQILNFISLNYKRILNSKTIYHNKKKKKKLKHLIHMLTIFVSNNAVYRT